MIPHRYQLSVRGLMVAVAMVAALIVLSAGFRLTYVSCHLCHNRKRVESRTLLGLSVRTSEAIETHFPTEPGHRHVWAPYARSSTGFLAESAAGHARIYQDGSTAPDGRR